MMEIHGWEGIRTILFDVIMFRSSLTMSIRVSFSFLVCFLSVCISLGLGLFLLNFDYHTSIYVLMNLHHQKYHLSK